MEDNQRKFTGVFIPAEIYENQELSCTDKILWAEIQALSGSDYCFASNAHFAKHLGISPINVSKHLSILKKHGFVEILGFDGRTRKMRAVLSKTITADPYQNRESSLIKIDNAIYNDEIQEEIKKTCNNCVITVKENEKMASSMPVPPEVAPTNNSKTANDYFDKFMEWWNTVLIAREENEEKNITKILVGSNARKAMFRSRWVDTRQFMTGIRGIKNPAPDQIFEFMTKGVIGYNYINSEFLQGKIKGNFHSHGYKFEFDSVFRPSMWTKLLENKFFNSELKRPID